MINISDIFTGTIIRFVGCGDCAGKTVCFFCEKGVKKYGEVIAVYRDFAIPTVEVKVKGSLKTLELTQEDINDPCLVESICADD